MTRPKKAMAITMIALAAIAGIISSVGLLSPQGQTGQAEAVVQAPPAADKTDQIAFQIADPRSYVEQTGKSAIVAEIVSEKVSAQRGGSANIQVFAKHLAGANGDQSINVKVLPPTGYILYPPSVAASTTPEQRVEAARTGSLIPGSIDLSDFMAIAGASEKAVAKSAQQTFDIVISVPKDLPDELLGQEIYIPINISATDSDGIDIPGEGTGVMVVVIQ